MNEYTESNKPVSTQIQNLVAQIEDVVVFKRTQA